MLLSLSAGYKFSFGDKNNFLWIFFSLFLRKNHHDFFFHLLFSYKVFALHFFLPKNAKWFYILLYQKKRDGKNHCNFSPPYPYKKLLLYLSITMDWEKKFGHPRTEKPILTFDQNAIPNTPG
ncbi:unnamed protein product [Blepharisma stoltei]|uniref:Uncharacterized protein n=1 Tax=Blepharisma stoltei TaxID=1481888 RepID=A0AAU9JLW7_9CILI|nr:unnamed protein product [Blepharisma stoltei]